jgi:hypothetical protein
MSSLELSGSDYLSFNFILVLCKMLPFLSDFYQAAEKDSRKPIASVGAGALNCCLSGTSDTRIRVGRHHD